MSSVSSSLLGPSDELNNNHNKLKYGDLSLWSYLSMKLSLLSAFLQALTLSRAPSLSMKHSFCSSPSILGLMMTHYAPAL